MVSLLQLAEITEEGVQFKSPHDGSMMLLTPEHSIEIQTAIGAYIRLDYVENFERCIGRSLKYVNSDTVNSA